MDRALTHTSELIHYQNLKILVPIPHNKKTKLYLLRIVFIYPLKALGICTLYGLLVPTLFMIGKRQWPRQYKLGDEMKAQSGMLCPPL
jgi:hypothetical protein